MSDTPLCVNCGKERADFDAYVCGQCATAYGLMREAAIRPFYETVFSVARVMMAALSEANSQAKATGEPHDVSQEAICISVAPMSGFRHALKFLYQNRLYDRIRPLRGDVVECGVGLGQTLIGWLTLAWDEGAGRKVWGFDSFQGFPPRTPEDQGGRATRPSDWAYDPDTGIDILKKFIDTINFYGLPVNWFAAHLTLIKGFFDDSLKLYTGDRVALLHIDADLYGSYRVVLEQFWDKVIPGGVVAFDEYAGTLEYANFPGARRAVDEFLTGKGVAVQRDGPSGKYFAIKP